MKLKTLNVKTHRDGSFFFLPFFFCTNGPCVYFTVVMKVFSHLLGHQSYSNAHYHNRGDGILYSAKSTVWNEIIQYSQKIHCIVLKSGPNFINMATFQSEIVILVRDTLYVVLFAYRRC